MDFGSSHPVESIPRGQHYPTFEQLGPDAHPVFPIPSPSLDWYPRVHNIKKIIKITFLDSRSSLEKKVNANRSMRFVLHLFLSLLMKKSIKNQ